MQGISTWVKIIFFCNSKGWGQYYFCFLQIYLFLRLSDKTENVPPPKNFSESIAMPLHIGTSIDAFL